MAVPTEPRYVDVSEMFDRVNVADNRDADLMKGALVAAEIEVDTYCGRSFDRQGNKDARYFRARSPRFVRIDDTIDIATVEVGYNTRAGSFTTFAGEYVNWDCNGGSIDMLEADSSSWPHPKGWVKVTPTTSWGWTAVPGNVAEAVKIQALKLYRRKDAPEGVLGFEGAGVVKISRGLDSDSLTLLRGWRRREMVNL